MINDNDHLKVTLRTKDLISFYKNAESLLKAIVKRKLLYVLKQSDHYNCNKWKDVFQDLSTWYIGTII